MTNDDLILKRANLQSMMDALASKLEKENDEGVRYNDLIPPEKRRRIFESIKEPINFLKKVDNGVYAEASIDTIIERVMYCTSVLIGLHKEVDYEFAKVDDKVKRDIEDRIFFWNKIKEVALFIAGLVVVCIMAWKL